MSETLVFHLSYNPERGLYDPERGIFLTPDELETLAPDERSRLLPINPDDPADLAFPLKEAIRREWIILDALRIGKIAIRPGRLRERVQTLWRWFRQVLPAQHLHARPRIRNEREFENALALLEKALASWVTTTAHSSRPSDAKCPEPDSPAAEPPRPSDAGPSRPRWHRSTHLLTVAEQVVRIAHREAPRQFAVLDLLEAAGWPADGVAVPHDFLGSLKDSVEAINTKLVYTRLRLQRLDNDRRLGWTLDTR
jgi:hypothetical protein